MIFVILLGALISGAVVGLALFDDKRQERKKRAEFTDAEWEEKLTAEERKVAQAEREKRESKLLVNSTRMQLFWTFFWAHCCIGLVIVIIVSVIHAI
jgi:hypothetical protein